MVRYERPSVATRCFLPLVHGLRRPFKPKIIRLLLAALFWLLTFAWMIFCGNLSSYRSPKEQKVLPDLLFDLFPHKNVYPLPEVFLYTLLTSAVGRMIFHKDGVAIARRFATIAGCIYILRGLTLIATSFPDPLERCTDYTPSWSLSNLLAGLCGDVMGHTVTVVLAALAWSQYSQYKIIKVLAWLISLAAMILFIVNRTHYTIDVLLSLFISVFCWNYYHMTLHLPTSNQNPLVRWMEKLDGVSVGELISQRSEGTMIVTRERGLSLQTVVNEALGTIVTPGPSSSKYKELTDEKEQP